jgi:2'-5' RNA ligase
MSMSKVYTSAVVIIPPENKWQPIQQIREKYDRNFNRWMPHITLLYPFLPKIEYPKIESQFSEKCKEFEPIECSLNKFRFFSHSHQNHTIWLDPEPSTSIINLQSEILKIAPYCNDVSNFKNGFKPHLSVGQIRGKKMLIEVIDNLQSSWKSLKFEVNKIFFISRENIKTSKFKIQKEINFNY